MPRLDKIWYVRSCPASAFINSIATQRRNGIPNIIASLRLRAFALQLMPLQFPEPVRGGFGTIRRGLGVAMAFCAIGSVARLVWLEGRPVVA